MAEEASSVLSVLNRIDQRIEQCSTNYSQIHELLTKRAQIEN